MSMFVVHGRTNYVAKMCVCVCACLGLCVCVCVVVCVCVQDCMFEGHVDRRTERYM